MCGILRDEKTRSSGTYGDLPPELRQLGQVVEVEDLPLGGDAPDEGHDRLLVLGRGGEVEVVQHRGHPTHTYTHIHCSIISVRVAGVAGS